tara:strand:- start:47 stop:1528 length:1482 start_codon:yes stop_codon:yes gene_type:complete
MTKITNKRGSLQPESLGEVVIALSIYRDSKRVEIDGKWNFNEFLGGWEVFESITHSALQARFAIQDSLGLQAIMTGSEMWRLDLRSESLDRSYFFRTYEVQDRSRSNQLSDMFIVHATTDEFLKNETVNIFGHSEVIFGKRKDLSNKTSYLQTETGTKAEKIVKKLLRGKEYINTKKDVFSDSNESINNHQFVSTNWRPFDLIYWLGQRTIRKAPKGGTLQNGYAFFENALGYHFKSIDGMIEEVNNQSPNTDTDFKKGKARLYVYEFTPKNVDAGENDFFKIKSVVFPNERSYLMGLRHGTWSGYSIGFDPTTLGNSKVGTDVSQDISADTYRYSNRKIWDKMSHIGTTQDMNPLALMDKGIKHLLDYPKRIRYTALPNQIFDPKFKKNPQKNYEQLVELQAYQWMRIESLKNIRLEITIPGNLDLYVGYGVHVTIPAPGKVGDTIVVDKKYSGRYIIASLSHQSVNDMLNMQTTLLLVKDTIYGKPDSVVD